MTSSSANSAEAFDSMEPSATTSDSDAKLRAEIARLGPWHMNIQLTESVWTGEVFASGGAIRDREQNKGISLLNLRLQYFDLLRKIFPQGVTGKTLLDCACNAGGYSFWSREIGMQSTFGFDVREHWIQQARFVQAHRQVAPTSNTQFAVCDLYDLPKLNCSPVDIAMFKGIFYHLPDPVTGLKLAADLTREVMIFNTSTLWGEADGYLKCGRESRSNLMSGVHGLKWYATGPKVLAEILKWAGFVDLKLHFQMQQHDQPQLGRIEIIASKVPGLLEKFAGESLN
jgi:tRNA (mo5U34)-methyltransferase